MSTLASRPSSKASISSARTVLLGATLLVFAAAPHPAAAECVAPAWEAGTSYVRKDLVSHAAHEWRAKRSSEGVVPGTHKPSWTDLGACGPVTPPPPPPNPTPIEIFGVWHADYVTTVAPNGAGLTPGMLGYMFWAAEYPSARKNYVATVPPNTCEDGMGVSATMFSIPIPMQPLRQE